MKNLCASLTALAITAAISACAHYPDWPKLDRSPGFDLAQIAKQYNVPRCKVSVTLTQDQVLRAARLQGDPNPEDRSDWADMVRAVQPGDELRQVICLTKGKNGLAAGDVFCGLFRTGKIVAEMHNVIIN